MKSIFISAFCVFFSASLSAQQLGEEDIREDSILRMMEKEIGLTTTRTKTRPTTPAATQQTVDSRVFQVTLTAKNGSRISGTIRLTQKTLILVSENQTRQSVAPRDIRTLRIESWEIHQTLGKNYYFPAICTVVTAGGETFHGRVDAYDILQFTVRRNDNFTSGFTYFTASQSDSQTQMNVESAPETVIVTVEFSKMEAPGSAETASTHE